MRRISKKTLTISTLGFIAICLVYAISSAINGAIKPPGPMLNDVKNAAPVMGAPVTQEYKDARAGDAGSQSIRDGNSFGQDSKLPGLELPSINERIVRNANLELEVKKGRFDSSYERVTAIAKAVGGYVSQSRSQIAGESITSGEILIRIPADDFEQVLADLKRLGKVKSAAVSSEDVSEEYVDLQSRLKNWQAQEVVLLELMKKANSVAESISVQNNLSQVQMEIERINGRLNFLENRVSYATVRLYMTEPQAPASSDRLGLRAALESALHASMSIIAALIVTLGYLLPLVVLVVVGYGVYRRVNTMRRPATSSR